ncbi:hypothetical protein T12_16098 [Trichinella patagoniensis]|uniref:Uncharacterized protein n=1 Tax=Trichinella patagoniensis TaxID=990121 RepID=A0A0V1AF54_9BILA|nr:hypothetical protein T12_16098 [Trichinella patagoniensis]
MKLKKALLRPTWLSAHGIWQESPCTYPKLRIMQTLLADLQFDLDLSDLCCFCENMVELSPDMEQLPCE